MFLDTSGLLCVLNEWEPRHSEFVAAFDAAHRTFTTDHVLSEFVALAQARLAAPRGLALAFVADLLDSDFTDVVFVDESTLRAALGLLQDRSDKEWSLCDATSFVLMGDLGVWEALTLDHHFEQAGFVRVPAV